MKDVYEKLEIPEASAGLEAEIIRQAAAKQRTFHWPRLAVVAACALFSIAILQPTESTSISYLDDVDFFDEQYGFAEEIS